MIEERIEQLEARIARLEMKEDAETMTLFPFCRKHRPHFGSLGETKRYWEAAHAGR